MAPPDLNSVLRLHGPKLTIDRDSATGDVIKDQLTLLTGGAPIIVRNALRTVTGSTVTVIGNASLLNVSDMPVTASATVENGAIILVVSFHLIEGLPTAASWRFSNSFSNLPPFLVGTGSPATELDATAAPAVPLANLLDRLSLSDARLVLASAARLDAATGVPLAAGLNFVAKWSPTGLLGLLESLVSSGQRVVHGPIILPPSGQATLPMPQMKPLLQFPWQLPTPIPGIQLTADLGIDTTLGNLRLHDVGLRIYCPPTQVWAASNPSFVPILAATAKLEVPSAHLSLDLTALGITAGSPMLFGQFDGVTVDNLAQLLDLTGVANLQDLLPSDLNLGKLSLLGMTVFLSKPGNGNLSLDAIGVTVGLPGIETKVLPSLTVRQLVASFSVESPFVPADRAVSLELGGSATFLGATFDVVLTLPEVVAAGRLTDGATLPLATLTQALGLPATPPLTINELQFAMGLDGSYAVAAVLADNPPWTLDLGPGLTLSDLRLVAQHPKDGAASGTFSGLIALNDLSLGFSYQSPGDFVLRGELPDASLLQLVGALTTQASVLPGGFDVTLTDGSVLIQKAGTDLVFLYATTMAGVGTVAFEARRVGASTWGFAAGIDLQDLRISGLPGLSALQPFEDLFHLDEILVVVSSFADPAFQMPSLAAFNTPAIGSDKLQRLAQAGGVVSGLNAYARWTIDTSSRQQDLLRKLLGLAPTLGVTLQVSGATASGSRLFVSYDTTLLDHYPLSCQFGLQMKGGQASVFLLGTLQATIQGQPCSFAVELLFVPNGAFLSGEMKGSFQFQDVTLSNLEIVMGIDWEGIPSLGIAAEIATGRFESSLALFFDSTDPSRSMAAGSVSNLSLKDVIDTLAGPVLPSSIDTVLSTVKLVGTDAFTLDASLAKALDDRRIDAISAALAPHFRVPSTASQVLFVVSKPGREWFLTDMTTMRHYQLARSGKRIEVSLEPQIYVVPSATSIGTLRFDPGFFLDTGLSIFSFQGSGKVLIQPSQGIVVDGAMDPIVIGSPALLSITSADGSGGPRVSAATMRQPQAADPALRDPHFLLDARLTLLGLSRQVYVNLSASGLVFDLGGTLVPGATGDLHGRAGGAADLSVGGSLQIAVPTIDLGPRGRIDLGTGAQGSLDLGVQGTHLWARLVKASFELAGASVSLPTLDLDVTVPSLLDLPKKVVDQVVQAVSDAVADPSHWAGLVRQGAIKGVSDVARVLRDHFKLAAQDAAAKLRAAGYAAGEVGAALKTTYNVTATQAASFLKGAGYAVSEVGAALKTAYGAYEFQVVELLKGAGYTVSEVAAVLKTVYGDDALLVRELLKSNGYTAAEVGSALKNVYLFSAYQASYYLKNAYPADQVASMLSSTYGVTANQAAQLFKDAGYAINEIADAIKSCWHLDALAMALALGGTGATVDQTGRYLKDVYNLTPVLLQAALAAANYTQDQIRQFFVSLGGEFGIFVFF